MLRREGRRRRPRAAWAALITAIVLCALLAVGVLFPVLGLIGGVGATTLGAVRIPVGAIAASVIIGYLVALLLLVLTALARVGALAWITAVAAVVAAAIGSVWPLVATAFAGAGQVSEVIPFIQRLLAGVG